MGRNFWPVKLRFAMTTLEGEVSCSSLTNCPELRETASDNDYTKISAGYMALSLLGWYWSWTPPLY